MRARNLFIYLRRPGALMYRAYRELRNKTHPGEPWMALAAIRFLDSKLNTSMMALEWGSGRSTLWFASRVGQLLSVEHNPEWFASVQKELTNIGNVDLRLVDLDADKENGLIHLAPNLPAYVQVADEFPDDSLDLVIVDGMYRISCAIAVQRKVKRGGVLAH